MIIDKQGYEFEYERKTYAIGDRIVGTDQSEYEGLFGHIIEIRTGKDKETENETPDMYCSFEAPALPCEIGRLEKTFSDLYDEPKVLDDISLDMVIMAPDMIEMIEKTRGNHRTLGIYQVEEDWAVEGDYGKSTALFTDPVKAKLDFHEKLSEEIESASISRWRDNEMLVIESGEDYYEGWKDEEFCENHYCLSIKKKDIMLSDSTFGDIGRAYENERSEEDFKIHLNNVKNLKDLSEKQCEEILSQTDIPELVRKKLGLNDRFWEAYWDTIADAVNQAIENTIEGR